jgi:hypothetical protein
MSTVPQLGWQTGFRVRLSAVAARSSKGSKNAVCVTAFFLNMLLQKEKKYI